VKKAFIIVPWLILAFMLFSGCALFSSDTPQTTSESDQVNSQQTIYANNQPIHQYDYSPERDALQQIYDARMKDLNTWSVIFPPASSGIQPYVCPSVGYPIPYTTQFTNPDQVHTGSASYDPSVVLPQAEPNGLYTGNTDATWVRCVRKLSGGGSEVDAVYSEPAALTYPYPIKIENGSIIDAGGNSSFSIKTKLKG